MEYCDNDVVGHQVVNLEFENEITASSTMSAFTVEGSRAIKIMETHGQIKGDVEKNVIEMAQFANRHVSKCFFSTNVKGQSGGDDAFMSDFIKQIQSNGEYQGKTSIRVSLESHLVALAAEKSRLGDKNI